jgi:hypothetical protein
MVLYIDRGISPGMQQAREIAELAGIPVEERRGVDMRLVVQGDVTGAVKF